MKVVEPDDPTPGLQSNPPGRIAQVLRFQGVTLRELPVSQILEQAAEADLGAIVVLGLDKDGEEYFAGSFSDGADVVWLMERAKLKLMGAL